MSDATTLDETALSEQGAYDLALALIRRASQPDPALWLDEWSEAHMVIPKDTGAKRHGAYRFDSTPFARPVLRWLSPEDACKRVVVMGASQIMKTQIFLNAALGWIDGAPANIIAMMPSGELVKRLSARIDKSIAAVPRVAAKVAPPRSRDARHTVNAKDFAGGTLFALTSGSAKNLAEIPARYGYADEVDRWLVNVQGEGSGVKLFEARFTQFEESKKLYYTSSPTHEETSQILALYKQGDQCKWHVPCPHCEHYHEFRIERLIFDGVTARMACPECGGAIEESDKQSMIARGHLVAESEYDGETHSLHISAFYAAPGSVTWTVLAKEYAEAKVAQAQGDDTLMQVFYNTRLALPWSAAKSTTDAKQLKAKALRENLPPLIVPRGALIVTAAVDTQGDRLEFQAEAWGEGMESWVIDKHVFVGNPAEDQVWAALDEYVRDIRYTREDGHMPHSIARMFVDSGGHHTQDVYNFTRRRKHRGISALKGASHPGKPILARTPSKVDVNWRGASERYGAEVWIVGTDTAKDWIAARYQSKDKEGREVFVDGPGAMHFHRDMTDDDFEQLTAEYRVAKLRRGHKIVEWHKKKNVRNEGLDLKVYNLAAAYALGLQKYSEQQWQLLRDRVCPPLFDHRPAEIQLTAPPPPPPANSPAPNPFASDSWSSRL